jgi:diguanylate cyclase (GGDEF)-like protein
LKRRFHNVVLQTEGGGRELADAPWTRRDLVLGGVAVLLLGAVSLLTRNAGQLRPLLVTVELALALACFGRALTRRTGRRAALALGAGLLAWALGGIAWALVSPPTTPSVADLFSLLFYPLAAVALLMLVAPELEQRKASAWLDATVTGLGAAAICSALAFDGIVRVSGSAASVAVSLAYPVGAVVLFALALGVVVLAPRHPGRTLLFALGSALMALGGIVSLHQLSPSAHETGAPLDLLVPAAMVALTGSLWLRSRPGQRSPLVEKAPRVTILVLVLAASLVLLVLGNLGRVNAIALGLAGATIIVAAARMAVSLREQRALNVSQQQQATTDDLTGLGNRRRLLEELQQALAGMPEGGTQASGLALLLIDLDHFKEINDSFGHQTGDALLREIGPRIRQVVRRNDLVARLGGDEFAVVLYGADAYKATTVARRITTLLQEPIDVSTASLHVGASIGVALAPEHATSADELIRCADIAMYRAKNERGSFDVYEAALDDEGDRFELIEDLRVAMADRSLALHYQPVIDLRTGEVLTVEALLRWPHPTLGLIPPEHLLALAEESGLIHSLATWVFEEAVADCARWWHDGHRAAVAVNLLATDLLDSSLPRRVGALLAQAGLPPDALVLEITEGMVVADVTRSKRVIQSLTDSGIRVSIDDFGTGFSSISHLNELAVGELKLDRTFTSRLQGEETGGRDEDIVRSIIHLGHALGLRVVAEGIERLAFIEKLIALGCDAGQGYAIQAPGPAAAIDFAGALRSATGPADESLPACNQTTNLLAP